MNDAAARGAERDHSIASDIDPISAHYTYRRPLDRRGAMIATGVAAVVGAAAFYLTRVMLERTPLELPADARGGERDRLARSDRGARSPDTGRAIAQRRPTR